MRAEGMGWGGGWQGGWGWWGPGLSEATGWLGWGRGHLLAGSTAQQEAQLVAWCIRWVYVQ